MSKKIFVVEKRRIIISVLLVLLYLGLWSVVQEYSKIEVEKYTVYFLVDFFLILGLMVKIQISRHKAVFLMSVACMLASALCFFEIEFLHGNMINKMKFLNVFLNYILILFVFLLIHLIFNRFKLTMAAGMSLFTFYGILYDIVKELRGNGLRAADLYAAQTAINVAGGYSFELSEDRFTVILWAFTFVLLCCYVNYHPRITDRIKTGVVSLVFTVGIFTIFTDFEFMEENSIKPYLWELSASETDHGALLDFAAGLPYLKMQKPEGYSKKTAEQIEAAKAQTLEEKVTETSGEETKKPHIIAIMNESFSDFRKLGSIELNQEILKNWDALDENVIKGSVSVPVFGGWTPNSEFEFLTGFTNAFFQSGVIPFQNYVKTGTPNIGMQLQDQGYTSIFLHPMDSTGWNRKNVYQALGFDYAYYIEDMKYTEKLRHVISDRSDYEELIYRYEEQKENGPVFLFNVTIQNHGGYTWGGMENQVQILNPEGNYPNAEEYLTLIRESDETLRRLLDYFSKEEEPVVVCMFGDHYPKVEEELYSALAETTQGSEIEKTARKYQVPFMIYTNYEIEEKEFENISLNYLSTLLCETAGIPLTQYQQYLKSLFAEYPVVNVYGVKNQAGEWFSWDEASEFAEIKEYEMVQYKNLFDNH